MVTHALVGLSGNSCLASQYEGSELVEMVIAFCQGWNLLTLE